MAQASEYRRLFTPLTIGSMTVPNRIVMAPHSVAFTPGYGGAIDRVIDYHVERARGGAGMIVMSNFLFLPSWRKLASWGGEVPASPLGTLDVISDPELIPSYRRLAEGVHSYGAKFISQINASGRQLHPPGTKNFAVPLFAPSALPCPRLREIPKEMEVADIEEFVATFAASARNLREAGGDGVELFAAQGYLLHEFLSLSTNKRTDRYGGSLENRMRFLMEGLRAIRKAVGTDLVVGVRLNASDDLAGGIDLSMAKEIVTVVKDSGLVDYINVSGLTSAQYPGWIADMTIEPAQFAANAGEIRAIARGLPICVVSRISSPEEAENILATGQADMVGMARALIADPEWPNKARAGLGQDIRKCTYSNQSCLMGLLQGKGMGCVHNPAVGRERHLGIGTMRPAARPKRVAVVGGGPAGMATARVAAERGHNVTLFEKADRLGGQNLMTQAIATRSAFGEVTRWQEHMLRKSNVAIHLRHDVTAAELISRGFDAVIMATGSVPRRSGYSSYLPEVDAMPGVEQENVFTIWDVFHQPAKIGRNVLLIDDDTHLSGTFVAEHLADNGRTVTIATPHLNAAPELHPNHVPDVYRRLGPKRVRVMPNTVVLAIDGNVVRCRDRYSFEEHRIEGVDSVVLAMGNHASRDVYDELHGKVAELQAVGDCLSPRRIEDAILDGERAAWML